VLKDKRVVVTGGTGSLGKVLVRRLLTGEMGMPRQITVFSRDEAKQHQMRLAFQHKRNSTDEVIYHNFEQLLQFRIGDVRDTHSVSTVLRDADAVFNAAALKQVPSCEYFPFEAVQTNVLGAENIVSAAIENDVPLTMALSTDKAVNPVNLYGATKLCAEKIVTQGNAYAADSAARFANVRYGNVVGSRGSVVPRFRRQLEDGRVS